MQLLLEIKESDVGLTNVESFISPYILRKAARALIFNTKQEIAFMHVTKHGYHKLPGGGIDAGEDIHTALKREAQEEVGTDIVIGKELGMIIEYRNENKLLQISYCFIATTVGEVGTPHLTEEELANGLELLWVTPVQALHLLEQDVPTNYDGKFIRERDLSFLRKALELI